MDAIDSRETRPLDPRDVTSILARNSLGRLAFARGRRIDVLPIQYVYHDGAIYGRTAKGGKLDAMGGAGVEVAFEVDEIRSTGDWRCVLAHGTFEVLSRNSGHEEWLRALGLVRRLHRSALRPDDPRPERTEIFRIRVRDASGRALE